MFGAFRSLRACLRAPEKLQNKKRVPLGSRDYYQLWSKVYFLVLFIFVDLFFFVVFVFVATTVVTAFVVGFALGPLIYPNVIQK